MKPVTPLAALGLTVTLALAAPAHADPYREGLFPIEDVPAADLARQRLPEGGLWVAALGDQEQAVDRFFIYRLERGGVVEAFREDGTTIYDFGWADADTLWTVATYGPADALAEGVVVRRFVRGALDHTWQVPQHSWSASGDELPRLRVGPKEVALARCTDMDQEAIPVVCRRDVLRRLEDDEWVHRLKLDRTTTSASARLWEPTLPAKAGKPPRGLKVTKAKVDDVRGVRCEDASGAVGEWPATDLGDRDMQVQPARVTWIHGDPPLFAVRGKRNTPVEVLADQVQVLRGCPPSALRGFHWLGDGIWLELADLHDTQYRPWQWRLWVDHTHVASLQGGFGRLVPAPRR